MLRISIFLSSSLLPSSFIVFLCLFYTRRRLCVESACAFNCYVSSYMCRVHFSRAVLFCQPHQQLFTDSYRETEPSCSNAESDSLPLRAWISLPLLPEASASRKTVFSDKNFRLMVLGGWNGGRPSEVTLHLSMLLPENISTIALPSFFDRKTAQNSKNKPENLR